MATAAPAPTKIALAATLALTAATVAVFVLRRPGGAMSPSFAAPFLWLFSALFLVRVAGQVVVRTRSPAWLPPTEEWNLTPYRLLLPVQLTILALMAWIDTDFSRGAARGSRPGRSSAKPCSGSATSTRPRWPCATPCT